MNELWNLFKSHALDAQEFAIVVGQYFNSHSQPEPDEVIYPGDLPFAIRLRYSEDNTLKAIDHGPALTPELRHRIESSVLESLVARSREQIWCGILFANQPLKGSWRYHNSFQLDPPPEEAPKPKGLLGSHPFVVETMVDVSSNPLITQLRFHRRLSEIEKLLAGLVQGSIHHIVAGSHWIVSGDSPSITEERWSGYATSSIPRTREGFSEIHVGARVLPAMILYRPTTIHMGAPLTLPDTLEQSLDCYHGLLPNQQRRFLRACYWMSRANQAMVRSDLSVAFMAIVAATETLFESGSEECQCCRQQMYKLSDRFVEWMDTYAPLDEIVARTSSERTSIRSRLKDLYNRRSELTHGRRLMVHDVSSGYSMTPMGNLEHHDLLALLQVMPVAFANWLTDASEPPNKSLTLT